MLGKSYQDQTCSIARCLEVVGERWSLLIIRDAVFAGRTRFVDFQRSLGIASNVLTARLETFLTAGLMTRQSSVEPGQSVEYLLTEKGRALGPVLLAMVQWGDEYAAPSGPPYVFEHAECGEPVEVQVHCPRCERIHPSAVGARPGEGLLV